MNEIFYLKSIFKFHFNFKVDSDDQALSRILSDVVVSNQSNTKKKRNKINSFLIKERSTESQTSNQSSTEIIKVEKLDLSQFNTSGPKKKSLFAQNLEKKGMLKSFYPLDKITQPNLLSQNEKIKTIEKSLLKY